MAMVLERVVGCIERDTGCYRHNLGHSQLNTLIEFCAIAAHILSLCCYFPVWRLDLYRSHSVICMSPLASGFKCVCVILYVRFNFLILLSNSINNNWNVCTLIQHMYKKIQLCIKAQQKSLLYADMPNLDVYTNTYVK